MLCCATVLRIKVMRRAETRAPYSRVHLRSTYNIRRVSVVMTSMFPSSILPCTSRPVPCFASWWWLSRLFLSFSPVTVCTLLLTLTQTQTPPPPPPICASVLLSPIKANASPPLLHLPPPVEHCDDGSRTQNRHHPVVVVVVVIRMHRGTK